jgi:hypothetical protein
VPFDRVLFECFSAETFSFLVRVMRVTTGRRSVSGSTLWQPSNFGDFSLSHHTNALLVTCRQGHLQPVYVKSAKLVNVFLDVAQAAEGKDTFQCKASLGAASGTAPSERVNVNLISYPFRICFPLPRP